MTSIRVNKTGKVFHGVDTQLAALFMEAGLAEKYIAAPVTSFTTKARTFLRELLESDMAQSRCKEVSALLPTIININEHCLRAGGVTEHAETAHKAGGANRFHQHGVFFTILNNNAKETLRQIGLVTALLGR